ncbi:cyclic nucleotide-binding domain-containing protein [Candidatus Sumerlaeota bacterium]|nr:cyclic nucleotide-binding domain-containing protein [Candidatus Sumerlaeota bacterium]
MTGRAATPENASPSQDGGVPGESRFDLPESMASSCRTVSFAQGETVFREGDAGDTLYICRQGEFVVLKEMGWGQRELRRIGPGEMFGEMAPISSETRSATLRAVRPSQCLAVDERAFNDLLQKEPGFANRILALLSRRLRESDEIAGRDLLRAHQALIVSLAQLAESRDPDTGAHIFRVRDYCVSIAERLAERPEYRDTVDSAFVRNIYFVSPLHDIGKVAIPDRVLLKPGRLTDQEFRLMQSHAERGAESLRTVLGFCNHEMFQMAYRVVRHHHERYDGKGYPDGLTGEAIPLEARIMSLADTFDALISRRVYKEPFSRSEARDQILGDSGARFDPILAAIFIQELDTLAAIQKHYES